MDISQSNQENGSGNADWQMKTAVVLLVFNRPELTRQVFARVQAARPPKLLVVADGPRMDRPGERGLCADVREIATAVDWPCEVLTEFAPVNLGCRQRVVSGLTWAFSHVEEAIILEDDILPDPSFFRFCEEMLDRYRGDQRVSMITGFNHSADRVRPPFSYFFSELTHIWGWATWRSAWAEYDGSLATWPEVRDREYLAEIFAEKSAQRYWTQIFNRMHRGEGPNTWDYQWMYTNLCRRWLSITPQVNLVSNLGFGVGATHVSNAHEAPAVSVGQLAFPLNHPTTMIASRSLDAIDQQLSQWHTPSLPTRAVRKMGRALRQKRAA